jgi:hypothetical protein
MPAGADFLAQIQGQNKQEHDVPARPAVNPLTAMLQKRNAGPPASINNQQTKATETTKRSSEFLFRSDQSKHLIRSFRDDSTAVQLRSPLHRASIV